MINMGFEQNKRGKDDLNCCRIGATQACTATVDPMARMWRGRDLEIRTLSFVICGVGRMNGVGEGANSDKTRRKSMQERRA